MGFMRFLGFRIFGILVAALFSNSCADSTGMNLARSVMQRYSIRKTFTESAGTFSDSLLPLFPNPFNHNTGDSSVTINFSLRDSAETKVIIQNPVGDSVVIFQ